MFAYIMYIHVLASGGGMGTNKRAGGGEGMNTWGRLCRSAGAHPLDTPLLKPRKRNTIRTFPNGWQASIDHSIRSQGKKNRFPKERVFFTEPREKSQKYTCNILKQVKKSSFWNQQRTHRKLISEAFKKYSFIYLCNGTNCSPLCNP